MPNIKVSLRNVCKVFDPAMGPALDGVSLDIAEGSICVLMGLSGSGKSTLLRSINGLVAPSAGQVLVDGADLGALAPRQLQQLRRQAMGMVFQSCALFPHLSVIDNAAFGLELDGVNRAERHRRAGAVLEQVGLLAHAHQYPHQLSGGMRQRVGLARALTVNPSLLLMDEAFSALDPLKRRAMQELLLSLQREQRRTIVFVSHDVGEALRLGDHIALLHDGRLLQQGAPRAFLSHPAHEHVRAFFQGADTSTHLLAADLIDHDAAAAEGCADTSVAADTSLSDLLPRLRALRLPLAVRDPSGILLGLITTASALRTITRAAARG